MRTMRAMHKILQSNWRIGCALALSAVIAGAGPATAATESEPPGLLLTWQQDPTTTMTIDWHTDPEHEGDASLRYKKLGTDEWHTVQAASHPYAHSAHWSDEDNERIGARTVHRVELTGLEPRTKYRFQLGEFDRKYKFETIQQSIDDDPLVFGAGGDNGTGSGFRNVNRAALEFAPQFIAIGGDMAYEDGRADRASTMHAWFEVVRDTLVTDEGRVIPIVVSIGNHEMKRPRGGNNYFHFPEFDGPDDFRAYDADIEQWREDNAPYFFSVFAFPGQPGYGVLDFGDYLSLIMLDSDHANPVGGEQADWLEQVLAERAGEVTHLIPKYHEPGPYGSRRKNQNIGEHWIPHFEEYGVNIVFENHDHTFKRTPPIRNDRVSPTNGIVYLGDGAWGRGPRSGDGDAWYIERFESALHGYIVTLHGSRKHVIAFDDAGNVFDEYPESLAMALGLHTTEALTQVLGELLARGPTEQREAAQAILITFLQKLDLDRHFERDRFLHALEEIFDDRGKPTEKRRLAYQLLVAHSDQVNGPGETKEHWLERGAADDTEQIRNVAKALQAADLTTEVGQRLFRTLNIEAFDSVHEEAFNEAIRKPRRAFPEGMDEDQMEKVDEFRLPSSGWRFAKDERRRGHTRGWYEPDHDDSAWDSGITEEFWAAFLDEQFIGVGWYRIELEIPEMADHDALGLHFGGVDEQGWVWIDGTYVGQHDRGPQGWNVPFQLDVTDHVVPGQTHQITVRVANTAAHGGIWEPVHLRAFRAKEE